MNHSIILNFLFKAQLLKPWALPERAPMYSEVLRLPPEQTIWSYMFIV